MTDLDRLTLLAAHAPTRDHIPTLFEPTGVEMPAAKPGETYLRSYETDRSWKLQADTYHHEKLLQWPVWYAQETLRRLKEIAL